MSDFDKHLKNMTKAQRREAYKYSNALDLRTKDEDVPVYPRKKRYVKLHLAIITVGVSAIVCCFMLFLSPWLGIVGCVVTIIGILGLLPR